MVEKAPTDKTIRLNKPFLIKFSLVVLIILAIVIPLMFFLNARSSPRSVLCENNTRLKTVSRLNQIVSEYLAYNFPQNIQVTYKDKIIPLTINSLSYPLKDTVTPLLYLGKTKIGPFWLPSKLTVSRAYFQPTVDQAEIDQLTATVSASLDKQTIEPEIVLQLNGGVKTIKITESQPGEMIDKNKLIADLNQALTCPKQTITIEAEISTPAEALTENQKQQAKLRAENLINKSVALTLEYQNIEVKDDQLISFLDFNGSYSQEALLNYAKEISETINRQPENASFQFENNRVSLFRPAKDGLKLDEDIFIEEIIKILAKLESSDDKTASLSIPVIKTVPLVTNKEVNDLGINELVGRGTSLYYGSIAGRIHNLILASERLNGILIAPGDEFSFNKALGEISAATGYQPAYIIEKGRTVLGDGGGVCQTSTTMFRAILNAGLPITERHAHAYRVHYYEDDLGPGYDATVFSPSVDLKFINDTPAYLLLQTRVDKPNKQLIYELYGTGDGRVAEISKARIWARVPAPPDLYQDDPTLKVGVVKQIDWKAAGAKVAFDYKVTRNGEVLQEKTFSSNYRPWQAIYLRGTKI